MAGVWLGGGCCCRPAHLGVRGLPVAVLEVRVVPDRALFRKARKIGKITAQHRRLAGDMAETMEFHSGVGLAANQVGVLERIAVIRTPGMEEVMVLVNPEIVRREGERQVEEGCLSVPGYRGIVVRAVRVRARALDLNAKSFKVDAENSLLAQALEHEIDHLNGIMYMDHLVAHTGLYRVEEGAGDGDGAGGGGLSLGFELAHRRLHGLGDGG